MPETNPPHDCLLCPRLVEFRRDNQRAYPDFFNSPVPNWGDTNAGLLIVGLAPGLKGANRTGRPFTGDYAGDLLYATLQKFGLALGDYDKRPDDTLQLSNVLIANAVRCVPPQNKPVGAEVNECRSFLAARIAALPRLRAILCLGGISHQSTVRALGGRAAAYKFAHGARHEIAGLTLWDSYHCSRYNTNTGRLTTAMFEDVFAAARAELDAG